MNPGEEQNTAIRLLSPIAGALFGAVLGYAIVYFGVGKNSKEMQQKYMLIGAGAGVLAGAQYAAKQLKAKG